MSITRLSQYGVGVQAYEQPVDVDLSSANWGWTAYPLTVEYTPAAISRLGQFGVGVSAYPPASSGWNIQLTRASWGWQSFPIDIPGISVLLSTGNWGWAASNLQICSHSELGYPYSFNGAVWNSCVYNDYKYGPRTAANVYLGENNWGWQNFPITVDFQDPIDVDLTLANWGLASLPVAVSFGSDVQLSVNAWGWVSHPISAERPVDIDLQSSNWGWTAIPLSISFETNIGLNVALWGWQSFPLTVDVPAIDVDLQLKNWGWQSFPIDVRQTTLQQGDIDAIAQAVYDKLVTEGLVAQVLETWQRQGADPNYPQDIPPRTGTYITCGNMQIYVERLPDGTIRHTRQ